MAKMYFKISLFFLIQILFYPKINFGQNNTAKKPLQLSEIWNGDLSPQRMVLHSSNAEDKIGFIKKIGESQEVIMRLDYLTGRIVDTIFTNQITASGDSTPVTFTYFDDFEFSPNDSNVLIRTEIEPNYSSSEKSLDYVWDVSKKTLHIVSPNGKELYSSFSPDGKKIAFIREGNLYIKNLKTQAITAVTFDGSPTDMIYGMGDMLYENGFGIMKAYQWSPDSKRIAFLRLNEAPVKNFPITDFTRNYPIVNNQRYPIAGEAIPEPQVFVYQLEDKVLTKLDLGINPNQYIVGFKWMSDNTNIVVQQLNREQKLLSLFQANALSGKASVFYTEKSNDFVAIDPNNIYPIASRKSFLWFSEKDGFKHIHEMKIGDSAMRQITKNSWEDFEIKTVDEEQGIIYFTGNEANSKQQNLYKINFDGTGRFRITRDEEGHHNVWMSKNKKNLFDEYSNANKPNVFGMYNVQGRQLNDKYVSNAGLVNKLKEYEFQNIDFQNLRINDSSQMSYYIIKPYKETVQKMPLLFYVYGGNSKQEVLDQWADKEGLTLRYLANQGYYIVCVDPRGTPGKGTAFRKANWNHPGEAEIQDILALKKYLCYGTRLNIDTSKVGIMGWSYGGFLAALAQTKYAGSFKAAVAIAPVTNWRLYDCVYTERLLQAPSENASQYKLSSPVNYVDKYKNGLFIIHGTADDVVHTNNSFELSKELTKAGKYFEQHIYPDKNHVLSDSPPNATRVDLYKRIEKFLRENLAK